MPPQTDLKARIQNALAQFARGDLLANALDFFAALGYRSDKQISLPDNTARGFLAEFGDERFNAANALTNEWRSMDLVLQLTDKEINNTAQRSLFDSHGVDRSNYQSYLIFALELAGDSYSRGALAKITREVNKLFLMPALILFKHGNTLTLSVIDRRLHKRDESKDVLDKVTLIKDVRLTNTHRAHIEILFDLALPTLIEREHPQNFSALHDAWRKVLDTSELNKKFFRELANWFYWAQEHVTFPSTALGSSPSGAGKDKDARNATSLIRLITRLIFTWFIQEKDLVPPDLFDENKANKLLNDFDPKSDSYYKAILQNLFFGTLNTEMGTRGFRHEAKAGQRADDYMTHTRYRYKKYFENPDAWLELTREIPFLNGGLFECLDKEVEREGKKELVRVDGFSDHPDNELNVPNYLFFAERNDPRYFKDKDNARLNETFGTKNKQYEVRGLVRLLHRYKFTIDENTPIEQEVALDPELLGKVFENLLAAYNPETGVTARKQTGSFYTPREIVNYMVDEALMAYLESALSLRAERSNPPRNTEIASSQTTLLAMTDDGQLSPQSSSLSTRLRHLFSYTTEPHPFDERETAALIEAIDNLKLLDPACGSGAFPMGALHKLVFILHKLDPDNARWKAKQIAKASEIPDTTVREKVIEDIEQSFNRNELDYGRKLYLIENCIYGVDIQPIAVQIAKLRAFIALIVDERVNNARENRGIRPLPNLETKFVAANTLIGIEKPAQMLLRNPAIEQKEKELAEVRRSLFTARTRETKEKHRKRDAALRKEIGELLKHDGWRPSTANQLASWDPYDQNAHAEFFDAEWMFGITDGFDVVIGNPPYVDAHTMVRIYPGLREQLAERYSTTTGPWDLYIPFWELSIKLINESGCATLITPNKWLTVAYGKTLRKLCAPLIYKIADYSKFRAFENTGVFPIVSFLHHKNHEELETARFDENHVLISGQYVPKKFVLTLEDWGVFLSTNLDLILRLVEDHKRLDQLCNVEESFSVGDAYKLAPLLRELRSSDTSILKFVNTGTIDPYVSLWGFTPTTYLKSKYNKPVIPIGKFSHDFPRRFAQSQSPKIVISGMRHFESFLDEHGEWVAGISTVILRDFKSSHPPKLLLGILNSRFIKFFLRECYGSLSMDGGINFTRVNVSTIPIATAKNDEQLKIIKLVDRILAAKRADPAADTRALEREIDALVYQLYGLTEEEIKIVEGGERLDRETLK